MFWNFLLRCSGHLVEIAGSPFSISIFTLNILHFMCPAGLILQPFRHFTYVTTHSPVLPSLYLCHSSFSNPSVALPTSQFILQPFLRFFYVTSSLLNSPGEPPMLYNSTLPTINRCLQGFSRLENSIGLMEQFFQVNTSILCVIYFYFSIK